MGGGHGCQSGWEWPILVHTSEELLDQKAKSASAVHHDLNIHDELLDQLKTFYKQGALYRGNLSVFCLVYFILCLVIISCFRLVVLQLQ